MSENLDMVKNYIMDLDLQIVHEDEGEELLVVQDDSVGIHNLVIDCEPPIVILEQLIMPVPENPGDLYEWLLQTNNSLVHGAFCLDDESQNVLFRDTLQLEHLDQNEIEGTISALSLAMAEHAAKLLEYSNGSAGSK